MAQEEVIDFYWLKLLALAASIILGYFIIKLIIEGVG